VTAERKKRVSRRLDGNRPRDKTNAERRARLCCRLRRWKTGHKKPAVGGNQIKNQDSVDLRGGAQTTGEKKKHLTTYSARANFKRSKKAGEEEFKNPSLWGGSCCRRVGSDNFRGAKQSTISVAAGNKGTGVGPSVWKNKREKVGAVWLQI